MTTNNLIFREARSQEELEQLFRLRHLIFTNAYPGFISENPYGLNLDTFDALSHHFGLYDEVAGIATPIGYVRITGNESGETANWVRQLATRYHFYDAVNIQPTVPLPMMGYFHSASDKIEQIYLSTRAKGEKVVEVGRLCLLPELASLRLAVFMSDCSAVFVLFHKDASGIISCKENQSRVNSRHGFKPVEEISKQDIAGHPSLILLSKWSERYQIKEALLQKI
ncbi:MAG: hypothetical protein IPM82_29805 [Saprospiraceae bacterium]|nr:hypothetical protein [Saprospiraceae bacterium]